MNLTVKLTLNLLTVNLTVKLTVNLAELLCGSAAASSCLTCYKYTAMPDEFGNHVCATGFAKPLQPNHCGVHVSAKDVHITACSCQAEV